MKERNYKIAEKDNELPLGKMFSFALIIIEKAMCITPHQYFCTLPTHDPTIETSERFESSNGNR